jgi:hypothetical protein
LKTSENIDEKRSEKIGNWNVLFDGKLTLHNETWAAGEQRNPLSAEVQKFPVISQRKEIQSKNTVETFTRFFFFGQPQKS